MGLVICKQVTRPDYGAVPGEVFPFEHEFAEPVHYTLVIVDDPAAPEYRTPQPPKPEARVEAKPAAGTAKAGTRA
jgi:hypothetical protein